MENEQSLPVVRFGTKAWHLPGQISRSVFPTTRQSHITEEVQSGSLWVSQSLNSQQVIFLKQQVNESPHPSHSLYKNKPLALAFGFNHLRMPINWL